MSLIDLMQKTADYVSTPVSQYAELVTDPAITTGLMTAGGVGAIVTLVATDAILEARNLPQDSPQAKRLYASIIPLAVATIYLGSTLL